MSEAAATVDTGSNGVAPPQPSAGEPVPAHLDARFKELVAAKNAAIAEAATMRAELDALKPVASEILVEHVTLDQLRNVTRPAPTPNAVRIK